MRTAALVGTNGSIDWMCFPHFDSPSVFAGLLDDTRGAVSVSLLPLGDYRTKQLYWPDSNVLVTRFLSDAGVAEVIDYMPVGDADERLWPTVRGSARPIGSTAPPRSPNGACEPAFDFALGAPRGGGHDWRRPLSLGGNRPGSWTARSRFGSTDGAVAADFTLDEGEQATFVLETVPRGRRAMPLGADEAALLNGTVAYWRRWLSQCTYKGRWREMVHRSALMLKLLTFEPTGAIVAAPPAACPRRSAAPRNWDYRYTWIRDAAFTLYAPAPHRLHRGSGALHGLAGRPLPGADGRRVRCRVMYGIDGRADLSEVTLDHLEGYRGSRPVRIGNGAYKQLQLDIYGELMDAVYLYNKYGDAHLLRLLGRTCGGSSTGSATTGGGRTRASGRCAAAGSTSSTRS